MTPRFSSQLLMAIPEAVGTLGQVCFAFFMVGLMALVTPLALIAGTGGAQVKQDWAVLIENLDGRNL